MVLTHVDLIEKLLHYNRKFLCVPCWQISLVLPSMISSERARHGHVLFPPCSPPYHLADVIVAMERSKDKAAY